MKRLNDTVETQGPKINCSPQYALLWSRCTPLHAYFLDNYG